MEHREPGQELSPVDFKDIWLNLVAAPEMASHLSCHMVFRDFRGLANMLKPSSCVNILLVVYLCDPGCRCFCMLQPSLVISSMTYIARQFPATLFFCELQALFRPGASDLIAILFRALLTQDKHTT